MAFLFAVLIYQFRMMYERFLVSVRAGKAHFAPVADPGLTPVESAALSS